MKLKLDQALLLKEEFTNSHTKFLDTGKFIKFYKVFSECFGKSKKNEKLVIIDKIDGIKL